MNTDEHSVQTDAKTYGSQAPSQAPSPSSASPNPATTGINALGPDDFHPAVVAIERIETSGRKYAARTKLVAKGEKLARISADLMSALNTDKDIALNLRIQSSLINEGFNALLMKTTRDDGFDSDAFESALRAQKQYRMTCQMLRIIKQAQEQTEKEARKAAREAVRRNPNADPYAHQYMDR